MVQRTKNQNELEIGLWNAECDRCGFKFKNVDLKKEWNGLMTCKDCWEVRHPQDFLRGVPDDSSVPWSRPDSSSEGKIATVGDENKTLTVGTSNQTQDWNTTLTADRTATLDVTGAVTGDRFTIYRTGGGAFDLIIGSVKTTGIKSVTVVEFNGTSWQLIYSAPTGL